MQKNPTILLLGLGLLCWIKIYQCLITPGITITKDKTIDVSAIVETFFIDSYQVDSTTYIRATDENNRTSVFELAAANVEIFSLVGHASDKLFYAGIDGGSGSLYTGLLFLRQDGLIDDTSRYVGDLFPQDVLASLFIPSEQRMLLLLDIRGETYMLTINAQLQLATEPEILFSSNENVLINDAALDASGTVIIIAGCKENSAFITRYSLDSKSFLNQYRFEASGKSCFSSITFDKDTGMLYAAGYIKESSGTNSSFSERGRYHGLTAAFNSVTLKNTWKDVRSSDQCESNAFKVGVFDGLIVTLFQFRNVSGSCFLGSINLTKPMIVGAATSRDGIILDTFAVTELHETRMLSSASMLDGKIIIILNDQASSSESIIITLPLPLVQLAPNNDNPKQQRDGTVLGDSMLIIAIAVGSVSVSVFIICCFWAWKTFSAQDTRRSYGQRRRTATSEVPLQTSRRPSEFSDQKGLSSVTIQKQFSSPKVTKTASETSVVRTGTANSAMKEPNSGLAKPPSSNRVSMITTSERRDSEKNLQENQRKERVKSIISEKSSTSIAVLANNSTVQVQSNVLNPNGPPSATKLIMRKSKDDEKTQVRVPQAATNDRLAGLNNEQKIRSSLPMKANETMMDSTLLSPDNAESNFMYVPGFLEFAPEDYRQLNQLSRSTNVTVWEGDLLNPKENYSGRIIIIDYGSSKGGTDSHIMEQFRLELSIAYRFNSNKCFGTLVGYCEDRRSTLYMKTSDGILSSFLARADTFLTKRAAVSILRDIAEALSMLHNLNISHGHVSSDSVYIYKEESNNKVFLRGQLGNFSLATTESLLADPYLGLRRLDYDIVSVKYAAPEALLRSQQRRRARSIDDTVLEDIYGFGILAVEILTKKIRFKK